MLTPWSGATTVLLATGESQLAFLNPLVTTLQTFVTLGFLFFCPGMLLVLFFRLNDAVTRCVLALALSLAIDAALAGILLYTGCWSPPHILGMLEGLCLAEIALLLASRYGNFADLKKLVLKPLDRSRGQ